LFPVLALIVVGLRLRFLDVERSVDGTRTTLDRINKTVCSSSDDTALVVVTVSAEL